MCDTIEPRNIAVTKNLLTEFPIDINATASEFVSHYWTKYKENYGNNNSLNGLIFENIIMLALARRGIDNIYYQTELTYVPSAIFDIFLYSEETSIALSIKTTLRERWKQADLEALAVKQVHKNAKCYVLTLAHTEVRARRRYDSTYAGLDGFILADTKEFDDLLEELSKLHFSVANSVPIVKTNDRRHTLNDMKRLFDF